MTTVTPMMRQWAVIKRAHPDCLVLFRLGDFYEAFNEDAAVLAEVCDVTLTSRPVAKGERSPMAGVPYHAVDGYIAQLVRRGLKVAIVEQSGPEANPEKRARMSRPRLDAPSLPAEDAPRPAGRAIMERQVARIVTPGTLLEGELITARANNYLAALAPRPGRFGLAHVDVTTGEFAVTQLGGDDAEMLLLDELVRLRPAELIVPERDDPALASLSARLAATLAGQGVPTVVMPFPAWRFDPENAGRALLDHFAVGTLAGFGCADAPMAIAAAGAAIAYLQEAQQGAVRQVTGLSTYSTSSFMALDAATRRNLEITSSLRGEGLRGTLLDVLDMTQTSLGGRKLRQWLDQPLLDLAAIEERLDAVAALAEQGALRAELRAGLKGLPDLERLANRVLAGYAGPKELLALAAGLRCVPALAGHLTAQRELPPLLLALCRQPVARQAARIDAALAEEPPATLGAGGVIRAGYSSELDAIHAAVADARAWIAGLEARERARTGLKGLKVGYNKVFGYYLELPKAQAAQVPPDYDRKQTLVDAERYITPDLKVREAEVLGAEERIQALERQLYAALIADLAASATDMLNAARDVAVLDCLAALAEVARRHDYCRPLLNEGRALSITGSRHPVVERTRSDLPFVPNDIELGAGEIMLLTGPNMAGKSTLERQVALIVLMAQSGSFVPAARAELGLVDRIFTRIGAQDEIARGQSTFMVEMVETANILHHATDRSLLVLDELGRGTSTYDGIAIAWAVLEHLHNHPRLGARTVFATHYHELTQLADLLPRLRNYNMAVAESGRGVVFLHRIEPGAADRSYGIHVAELAGLPRDVTARAWQILARLEADGSAPLQLAADRPATGQLTLFAPAEVDNPVIEALRDLDPDTLTPLAALTLLYELRRKVRQDDG
jgi:DNA mismatch repair protein MutS